MQPASYGHQVVEKLHREALQTPCACRAEIQAMRKQRKQRPRKQRGASCSDSDKEDPPGLCVACRKHPLAFGAVTLFTRKCPQCNAVVHSNIRDGLIDTRNTLEARTDGKEPACGYQFMVEDVEVVQRAYLPSRSTNNYQCPYCNATALSRQTTRTHRYKE